MKLAAPPPIQPAARLFTQRGNSCLFSRQIKLAVPEHPVLDLRLPHVFAGHGVVSRVPADGSQLGWNPELIAVIGKAGRDIPAERALDHVAGYTLMIDHSASCLHFMKGWGVEEKEMVFRDHVFAGGIYNAARVPLPIGPWIVTKDEVGDPHNLLVSARENDRLVETVHSGALLFRFEETIAFLSRLLALQPGDMISTGSIGYDGYGYWDHYEPGSFVEASAERIGALRMEIAAQASSLRPSNEETPHTGEDYATKVLTVDRNCAELFTQAGEPVRRYPPLLPLPPSVLAWSGEPLGLRPWQRTLSFHAELVAIVGDNAISGYRLGLGIHDSAPLDDCRRPTTRDRAFNGYYGWYWDGSRRQGREIIPAGALPPWGEIVLTLHIPGLKPKQFPMSAALFDADYLLRELRPILPFFPGDAICLGPVCAPVEVPATRSLAGGVLRVEAAGFAPLETPVLDRRDANTEHPWPGRKR